MDTPLPSLEREWEGMKESRVQEGPSDPYRSDLHPPHKDTRHQAPLQPGAPKEPAQEMQHQPPQFPVLDTTLKDSLKSIVYLADSPEVFHLTGSHGWSISQI